MAAFVVSAILFILKLRLSVHERSHEALSPIRGKWQDSAHSINSMRT
jgi:hypothetical protein